MITLKVFAAWVIMQNAVDNQGWPQAPSGPIEYHDKSITMSQYLDNFGHSFQINISSIIVKIIFYALHQFYRSKREKEKKKPPLMHFHYACLTTSMLFRCVKETLQAQQS